MPFDRKNKRTACLKNKCRGRFGYPLTEEEMYLMCEKCHGCRAKDPIEYEYYIPELGYIKEGEYNKKRNCIIVFSTNKEYYADGTPRHDCLCERDRNFVKGFKDGKLITTREEDEAYQFFLDEQVDSCMSYILAHKNPWTVSIWNYEGNKIVLESVHYPNEHWSINGNLQPSLMNKTLSQWHGGHYRTKENHD